MTRAAWMLIASGAATAGAAAFFWRQPMVDFVRSRLLKFARADYALNIQSSDAPKDSPLAAIFADSAWSNHADVRDGKIMDWCGMAVAAWLYRAGSLLPQHRKSFWATDGVRSFFSYAKVGSHRRTETTLNGKPIEQAHRALGGLRKWIEGTQLRAIPLAKWDIAAGDVVLIAHKGQTTGADHITLVESFDGRYLTTYEGNASGVLANGKSTKSGVVRKTRDLANTTVKNTIFGIGRLAPADAAGRAVG